MVKFYLLIALSFSSVFGADDESSIRKSYREECLQIIQYADLDYESECFYNYHHFNSNTLSNYSASRKSSIKIAEFNVLHPGMSKTRYKDYSKIAAIIRQWDIVSVTELLPLISGDLKHNKRLVKFLKDAKSDIKSYESKLRSMNSETIAAKELKAKIKSLKADMKRAPSLYILPGYLEILSALHATRGGSKWSLILSPRGEAAKSTDVQEMVGYFYNSQVAKPEVNKYCKTIKTRNHGDPVACIPVMGREMLGQVKKDMFSRRPFFATFRAGSEIFNLLSSHVVFSSPSDSKSMRYILSRSYGVTHFDKLGIGINAGNYARFAEIKVTLDFMKAVERKFKLKNLIYMGDTNLESANQFWEETLKAYPGAQVYVDSKSTISEKLADVSGTPTNGLASDYDHFIFNPDNAKACAPRGRVTANTYSFLEGRIANAINEEFLVRTDAFGDYNERKYINLMETYVYPLDKGEKYFETFGSKKIKVGRKLVPVKGIVKDDERTKKYADGFQERVLNSQLDQSTYYSLYKQLVSDHLPIYLKCNI